MIMKPPKQYQILGFRVNHWNISSAADYAVDSQCFSTVHLAHAVTAPPTFHSHPFAALKPYTGLPTPSTQSRTTEGRPKQASPPPASVMDFGVTLKINEEYLLGLRYTMTECHDLYEVSAESMEPCHDAEARECCAAFLL